MRKCCRVIDQPIMKSCVMLLNQTKNFCQRPRLRAPCNNNMVVCIKFWNSFVFTRSEIANIRRNIGYEIQNEPPSRNVNAALPAQPLANCSRLPSQTDPARANARNVLATLAGAMAGQRGRLLIYYCNVWEHAP